MRSCWRTCSVNARSTRFAKCRSMPFTPPAICISTTRRIGFARSNASRSLRRIRKLTSERTPASFDHGDETAHLLVPRSAEHIAQKFDLADLGWHHAQTHRLAGHHVGTHPEIGRI